MASNGKPSQEKLEKAIIERSKGLRLASLQEGKKITYILKQIYEIKDAIIPINPFKDRVRRNPKIQNLSSDPKVQKWSEAFQYTFSIENGKQIQIKITDCIRLLQEVYDAAKTKQGLIDHEKDRLYRKARGTLRILHLAVDPFNNKFLLDKDKPIELMKYFSALETSLASLAPIESNSHSNPLQATQESFLKLSEDDKSLFIVAAFIPKCVINMERSVREKIFSYLLAERDIDLKIRITPIEFIQFFTELTKDNRKQFLNLLENNLTPNEKYELGKAEMSTSKH